MVISGAALANCSSEPVPNTSNDDNRIIVDTATKLCSSTMPQIIKGAKFSLYNILVMAVNEVRKASHMKRSHLKRITSDGFNENDSAFLFT